MKVNYKKGKIAQRVRINDYFYLKIGVITKPGICLRNNVIIRTDSIVIKNIPYQMVSCCNRIRLEGY